MALQLSDLIAGARARHPSFEKRVVPDASFARFATGYQRDLIARAHAVNRSFLAQQASIVFDIQSRNAVGTAGAGTEGGLPGSVTNGTASVVQAPVGSAVELDTAVEATVHYGPKPVTSATTLTLTYSGAAWTVNEHVNRTVEVIGGTGVGQRRQVASNTSAALTVTEAWDVLPDDTSTFQIVTPVTEITETLGAVASAPFLAERVGYLVRLTAGGVAYLDLTEPLVARYDVGIPLPPHHLIVGGTVRFTGEDEGSDLNLVDYARRNACERDYSAYDQNGHLFLIGGEEEWREVESIDLRYVPVAPAFTALADYLLLPDTAYSAMVDGMAEFAAHRVNGLEGMQKFDARPFAIARDRSEAAFLRDASHQKRRRASYIREG